VNSYVLNAALPNKKPYGVELKQQNEIINVFSTMRCPNAKNIWPSNISERCYNIM